MCYIFPVKLLIMGKNIITKFIWQRQHPSWCIVFLMLGIVAGCIFAIATRSYLVHTWIWVVVAIVALLFSILCPRVLTLSLAFVAGFLLANFRASFDLIGQEQISQFVGKTITITGTISEDPDLSETKTALRLKNLQIENHEIAGTLYVQIAANSLPQRSDIITLNGKLADGFGTFTGTMYRPSIVKLERPEPGDIPLHLRTGFAKEIQKYIESPAADLGLGYLLGVRSSLPDDLLDTLKVVGLTHIIVASGANLSILIGFARKVFGKISRWCGFLVAFVLVLAFVSMTGLTPSMTRAALVTILSLITWYVGRKFDAWRLLLIVAGITLLYNPMYILDLGWLLSFASFGGILILGPLLTQFFYGSKKPNFLASTLLESLSASLLCMPLLLFTFGQISLISLAANLLVLPTIPIAMALTFATGVCSFWPWLASLVGKGAELVLNFHLWIIDFLGKQTVFLIQIDKNQVWVFALYALLIIPFGYWWFIRKKNRLAM